MRVAPLRVTALGSLGLTAMILQCETPQGVAPEAADLTMAGELRGVVGAPARDGETVARWNELAYDIAFAEDSFRTFKGHRAFAMMHLAMHDAVNAVTPRYRTHTFGGRDPRADASAAAVQAAHDVLLALYPDQAARLQSELSRDLESLPDESAPARGVALGRRVARAHLEARRNDGWDARGDYAFNASPGSYRTTPPWEGFVLQPGFRNARAFGITAADQFRPPPPPALGSPAYADAFNEVKRIGRAGSAHRTGDQTHYAIWWMEFAEGSVNRLARRLVSERRLSLPDATRLFALLNMSLYDTYIAVWDAKYEFNHWRPYSAIREAGSDENAATEADVSWEPLRPTPPFPEYVSAHAAACAATFGILQRVLRDEGPFTMSTLTAPVGKADRRFLSFDAAAAECADSRVALGWHFRYATDAGLRLGRTLAAFIVARHLGSQEGGTGSRSRRR